MNSDEMFRDNPRNGDSLTDALACLGSPSCNRTVIDGHTWLCSDHTAARRRHTDNRTT